MPFEGVLFRHGKPPVRLEIGMAAEVPESVGELYRPAVVVVCREDLALFAEYPELYCNRHIKDSRKGLADLLLGERKRIPFIDAEFTSLGRLQQSARSLIRNAAKRNKYGIYILGVKSELFAGARESLGRDHEESLGQNQSGLSGLLQPLPGEEEIAKHYWGDSSACHLVRQMILRAARNTSPVLIIGETGTGKGIVARRIHECQRPGKPFIEVNCAAIPGKMLEAELFGYKGGAFAGAQHDARIGQWEAANGGTLFLDEVGDLPPEHQNKILTVLQRGRIRRMGSRVDTLVSARVIAATNRNLYGMVQAGKFREDLFYRLRQFVIFTPVLRDNPQDLALIAQKLWQEITKSDARLPREITDELCRHRWPGNARELRSVLGSLHNLFGARSLTREHISAVFQYFGLVAGYGSSTPAEYEPGYLQVECLRKVRSADDTIHACEVALKPLAEGRKLTDSERESLARIRGEMQLLLENRLDFGSHETYDAVSHVADALSRFLAIPNRKSASLAEFLHASLEPAITAAIDRLFAEINRLEKNAGAATPQG